VRLKTQLDENLGKISQAAAYVHGGLQSELRLPHRKQFRQQISASLVEADRVGRIENGLLGQERSPSQQIVQNVGAWLPGRKR
jgi:hypothetical protein